MPAEDEGERLVRLETEVKYLAKSQKTADDSQVKSIDSLTAKLWQVSVTLTFVVLGWFSAVIVWVFNNGGNDASQ